MSQSSTPQPPMKRITSIAPTAHVARRLVDWTEIIRDFAPKPEHVTAFKVTEISAMGVTAFLSYGRDGTMEINFTRTAPDDETTTGDVIWIYLPKGHEACITEEHRTAVVGETPTGEDIREPFPQNVVLGHLMVDGQRLVALMQRVHHKLVAADFIAR